MRPFILLCKIISRSRKIAPLLPYLTETSLRRTTHLMLKNQSTSVFPLVLVSVITGWAFLGCASINSLSLTPIPAERKNPVQAERSKIIILGFNFDNDFVDDVVDELKQQCPKGKVTGLLTKDENIFYFMFFVWKKHITATGYCVPPSPNSPLGSKAAQFRGKTPIESTKSTNLIDHLETAAVARIHP